MLLLLALSTAAAACDDPVDAAAVRRGLELAEHAFARGDRAAFEAAAGATRELLIPCLDGPLPREDAAAYQRIEGYAALLNGDEGDSASYFQAAAALADPTPWGEHALAPLDEGWWLVDGSRSRRAPMGRSYVLQKVGAGGRVLETQIVGPVLPVSATPAPDAGVAALLTPEVASLPAEVLLEEPLPPGTVALGRLEISLPLVGVGVASGLLSGSLYLSAQQKSAEFYDLGTPQSELDELKKQANRRSFGSVAFGVGAISAGTAALLVGRF